MASPRNICSIACLKTKMLFSLWGMVVRQFRLLIQAREILDGRGNKDDVARALGRASIRGGKDNRASRAFFD